ncbi:fimbria/pilus outer membrane usher protein [Serratia fonticola]|uniref:fimbria/pilus outer membrane usher protein n=1 Tax=Serratia fonticola TaxID=47917 RepID=UPI00192CE8C3|nr:fimbria/pilus outer membrane usher protein [Serratia fonticola]MBL5825955.1 fimbrial biogenesis outer membrane usher protein [Serratia fonticola]
MKRSAFFALTAGLFSCGSSAELYFDAGALQLSNEEKQQINLGELIQPSAQVPGEYPVRVWVNHQDLLSKKINFVTCNGKLCPELNVALLQELGVKTTAFPALVALNPGTTFTDIGQYIPQASAEFDFATLALKLSIPQAAMVTQSRDDIPPEKWDDGLTTGFVNYNFTGAQESGGIGARGNNQYLNLRSGANWGPWRLRNYSYYNHVSDGDSSWQSLQTFVERDIRRLRARLTLGESATNGLVFDSFRFKGGKLASDTEMLPESQRGFAPVIRGIALSNAQVEVWQRGNLIYQTFVSPGEFTITDLYPTASSGDLEVIIREASGNVRTFSQPFSAAPTMVREGQVQFAVTGGEYASDNGQAKASRFVQTEAVYGLFNGTTVYGGGLGADNYQALVAGVGQSLGQLGSLSFDVTTAKARFDSGDDQTGQSYQFRYSKNINKTGTTMTLAGYRYSTEGYYSFEEASENWRQDGSTFSAPKNRMQVVMSQGLGDYGSLSLSAYQQDYWLAQQGKTRSIMGSYNVNLADVSAGLSYSTSESRGSGERDQVWALNLSMPLNKWLGGNSSSALLSYNLSRADSGRVSNTATVSGTTLEDRNLNYSLTQGYAHGATGQDYNASSAVALQYTDSRAIATAGYANYYGSTQRVNYGLQGAIVAHPYGITLAQNLSDDGASALVRAPGASQVKIDNSTGLYTDGRGYAVVPYLSQYRQNSVMLDAETLGEEVDIANPTQQVIPTKGALVLADYQTRQGAKVFLTLQHGGRNVPFGAVVTAGDGVSGIVNENGEVFLSGVDERTVVRVSWGNGLSCSAPVELSTMTKSNGIVMGTLACR